MRGREVRDLVALTLALVAIRLASLAVVAQPGYTDAYYYALTAERLAHGQGLTADFVWNFLEAPGFKELPVPSHRFWMPLATVVQAAGIALLEPLLGTFRAAQAPIVALAALIPAAGYVAARALGAAHAPSLAAGALAGLGGAFAPAWVSLDNFVPAALLGTAFFLLYRRAAEGSLRAGLLAGAVVGLLYLARSEGALFGLALLALRSRAGLAGSAVALAFGLAWQARQAALGFPPDLLARTVLLDRYEDFFATQLPAIGIDAGARVGALGTNAVTFLFAFALVLVPGLAAGASALRARPDVRAYVALASLVYVVLSLAFTLHSTRGAYFHSLAALFPFGVALAVAGTGRLLSRRADLARISLAGAVIAVALVGWSALGEWDRAFNGLYRSRVEALAAIPQGRFLAIDAAAWRWISGRGVVVTPADGPGAAGCAAERYGARAVVLEPAHFSAYAASYGTRSATAAMAGITDVGDVRIVDARHFPCRPDPR